MMRHRGWFRLASHLCLPLDECLQKTTQRQFLAWNAWFEEQWNEPNRSDHLLMQISMRIEEIQEGFRKNPRKVTLDRQRIKFAFGAKRSTMTTMTREQATMVSKAKWRGITGVTRHG